MAVTPIGSGGAWPVGEGIGQLSPARSGEAPFAKAMQQFLGDANAQQLRADAAVQQLAMGQTNNLHDVMLAVAKADLSFRLILEVRNRLTEAYQEVMRMQV